MGLGLHDLTQPGSHKPQATIPFPMLLNFTAIVTFMAWDRTHANWPWRSSYSLQPIRPPMLTYILIGLAVLIIGFLIAASLRPDELRVERRITLSAPAAIAFGQINELHKWQEMSPYVKEDPAAKTAFTGPAAGVGASFSWSGNVKVGEGRMTIMESRPHELVRFKFEFFKPWYCTNTTDFIFRSTPSGTEVTWAMSMKNNFIAKASGLVMNMDKMIGENFEVGLAKLKEIAEAAAKQ